MELSEMQARVAELEQQIFALPTGSITKKTVNGKEYFYHRWTENKYIPADELVDFRAQIERRKELEQELKALKKQLPKAKTMDTSAFTTNVRTGEALRSFASTVLVYRKRECFRQLHDYIYGGQQDKVFILYGLRRTGKTTMIRQIFAEMSEADLGKAAFIQITARDTLADVNRDLKALETQGFRYVFLDEVTLMEDFIEGAALFSDVFAACGMKIVLSGTDSRGFLFTEDEQLYDRCILLHTTFIPYCEFESVLGIHGIDEYIRYGGTMSLGGVHYNETSTFASTESADEYVDTASARNIQHSLRRDRKNPTDILDRIDLALVTDSLRKLLEIRNRAEQTVALDEVHAAEIKEYLDLLDLTQEIDVLHLLDVGTKSDRTVIAQPGLRYAQADALIRSLLLDETFSALSLAERTAVQERLLTEIKGRMLVDIVLLETKLANPKKQVFVLQFSVGEFDMVVFDSDAGSCRIFEIKHSEEAASQQYRHLIDEQKCAQTEHRYGPISGKFVLYRGESQVIDGIQYQNVEEYL